jgi:ribosome-associated translation inhibitor RaiA
MKILINSDSSIAMNAKLAKYIVGQAAELLDRFSDRLTRVEIHLSGIGKGKGGKVDQRCRVEARAARMKPLVASARSKEMQTSVNQALRKMVRALNTSLGKQGLLRTVSKPAPVIVPAADARSRKPKLAAK